MRDPAWGSWPEGHDGLMAAEDSGRMQGMACVGSGWIQGADKVCRSDLGLAHHSLGS